MAGDIKLKYLASVALADSGLGALAASSTYVAGYETNAVDVGAMSGGPPIDILLAGNFKAAAANHNAGNIEVWVIGSLDDAPLWPDVFDGTASVETVTSRNVLFGFGKLAAVVAGDSSNDRVYAFGPVSIAQLFGGSLPDQFVVFVTHAIQSSTNTWASYSAGPPKTHLITYTPVLAQYT